MRDHIYSTLEKLDKLVRSQRMGYFIHRTESFEPDVPDTWRLRRVGSVCNPDTGGWAHKGEVVFETQDPSALLGVLKLLLDTHQNERT